MSSPTPDTSLLVPGRTCWRRERAARVAFLVDAAAYYAAAAAALRRARRSVFVLGWDADPRVSLEPGRDGPTLGALLEDLVRERPLLEVRVLKWRTALPVAITYPSVPMPIRDWTAPARLRWVADAEHPPGAAHHQKVVVVDDAVAFCGGIDFARDRYDTPAHPDDEPRRRTPRGAPVDPHHDVMVAVDGDAAAALGDLCRERWRRATGEGLAPVRPDGADGDPWPPDLAVDVADTAVAIARTDPAWQGRERPIMEIEALYLEAIAAARCSLYIETQYLTAARLTDAIAARLAEPDGPEVVAVLPERSPSYFDHTVMDPPRDGVIRRLRAADRFGRLGLYAPHTPGGRPVVVHSKVLIADDRLLTVGSANLSRRSLGFDTECNLAVEAEAPDDRVAAAIRRLRVRLMADHLGLPVEDVVRAAAERGPRGVVEALRHRTGRLRPLEPLFREGVAPLLGRTRLLDPHHPAPLVRAWRGARRVLGRRPFRTAALALGAAAGLAAARRLARARARRE